MSTWIVLVRTVRRNEMNTTTESEKNASAEVPLPMTKRPPASKTKSAKKAVRAGKPASKPKADRANKKAEVIALMKAQQRRDAG
jgi:hypothetical protein